MRKTPISRTMRCALVELADAAAYSKRAYKDDSEGKGSNFHRTRWVVLEHAIENMLYVALHWPRDAATKYAVSLVLTREHHQTRGRQSPPITLVDESPTFTQEQIDAGCKIAIDNYLKATS